ncbi:hypothetical protein C2G38_2211725 [Gigaspora rosea]|uniref:Protein kinase domain-containing protein n=1 Tax=Gigaspora rosea TaxID=44941 RepID=A0A397UM24_9GLOM|nr:hypothetical protein C2G38_2211725 [Gigaspora rosea]
MSDLIGYARRKIIISKYKFDNDQVEHVNDVKEEFKVNLENILKAFGFTSENKCYYFVREFSNEENLSTYLRRIILFTWEEKITLLCLIFDGLKYLHNNNVDRFLLDPKNIIIHNLIPKITNIEMSKYVTGVEKDEHKSLTNYQKSAEICTASEIYNVENDKDNKIELLNIYRLGILLWEISSRIETFHENYDIALTIRITKVARKSPINRTSLEYIDLYKLCSHDGLGKCNNSIMNDTIILYLFTNIYLIADKRPIWHKIAEELENISCDQKYIENSRQVNKYTRFDKKLLILPDFDSLEDVESKRQIGLFFQLNKGRNRDGYNFIKAKKEIFENIEIKSEKVEFIPTVYFAKINVEPWEFLNNFNLSPRFDSDNLLADSNIIKILFPIRTLEYNGNLNVDFVQEIKDALKISDINEKRDALNKIFNENGKFVITKFIIGGAITVDCSKVDAKSIERLQAYLYWAIEYAKGEAQPVFELTSLDSFPSFETFPSRPMKIAKDLYSWLKDVYDNKDVTIISYESYKPSYELLDDKLKHEIFKWFNFKPTNQNLPMLIPQLPAEYKQKNFSEWISKSSLLLRVNELIEKLSLQCGIFLRHNRLGYGKKSAFKFLKEPDTTLMNKTTISFINSKNQQITYPLQTVNKFKLAETSYNITPLNYNYSKKNYFQIKYQLAKISLDSPNLSFGNCYNYILPKTIYIGGTLTKIYETCDIPDIPDLSSKFSQEILPEQVEQILKELGKNNNIDTTSFISNHGKAVNQNQINDWLKNILSNPENLEIISFEDWNPTDQMLSQLRDDVKFISENEYQMVFNGENSINYDQNSIAIKYPRPLTDDNCQIYGCIAKKYSDNLDESWERIPAAISFDQANRYGCNVIIHKNNNLKLNKVAAKIKWFVLAKSDGSYEDNYADSKVACGELDIDGSQNEIFIKTNNIQTNNVLATSFVHKSQGDSTCYYNITLKYWTKYRIVLKIHKEKQDDHTDFSNQKLNKNNEKKEIIEEKITLNWCVIGTNEKDVKNQNNVYQWNQCGVILDNDSRKDDDDEQNYQQSFENLVKIINLGSFLYIDKNSKGNEWIIQLDITVGELITTRNQYKDIKSRNSYALKTPYNAPTLNTLVDEIKINIFKFILYPKNLSLTCKGWNNIVNDAQAKAEWILHHYGNAHSLFHAVRLGPSFINMFVVQSILAKGGLFSRYFAQRLCMHFGRYDNKLIELKIRHMGQVDSERIQRLQQKNNLPWASNLPITVFTYLVTEASKRFGEQELALKGNDLELFHFYTAGPHVITNAQNILVKNIELIKTLINQYKFIPFPPRPVAKPSNLPEEYPPKDGYENNRQLNVIARAILIHKELVNMWIDIGYIDICKDVNDLVLQGAILILYPPTPTNEWTRPDVNKINERLSEFLELGFKLTYSLICDILQLFEHRLDDIGETLLESFSFLKRDEYFFKNCIIEAIKSERNLKKLNLLDFLYNIIKQNQEKLFLDVMRIHGLDGYLIDQEKLTTYTTSIKSLTLSPIYYYWALSKFKANSFITSLCFKDILETRISIDINRQNSDEILNEIQTEIEIACNIYNTYCNAGNFFLPIYINSISQVVDDDILGPLFKGYLPKLYKIPVSFQFPLPIIEIENDVFPPLPPINDHSNENEENEEKNEQLINEWSGELKKIKHDIDTRSDEIQVTQEFKTYLREFVADADIELN